MKKTLLFITLLISMKQMLYAQNAYYDALKLRSLIDPINLAKPQFNGNPDSLKKVGSILYNYLKLPRVSTPLNFEAIRTKLSNPSDTNVNYNPILLPILSATGQSNGAKFTGISSALSSVGDLDVTSLADGFAKFLVKRTKEELTVAFFSKFYDLIKKPEYKDAQILFPQTYTTLTAIGDEIYNYQAYINLLRESFEKDINGLLVNLPNVINDGRYSAFFAAHPELKAACLSSIYVGTSLQNRQHPGNIIENYDITLLDKVRNPDVKASAQTLQLFSTSLKANSGNNYWITKDELSKMIADPITRQLYLGLIYLKADGIVFKSINLKKILSDGYADQNSVKKITDYMQGLINQAEIVKTNIQNLTGKDKDNLTFTDYYNYYNSALDIVQYASNFYHLPGIPDIEKPGSAFQSYLSAARAGGNFALDIDRKNYSSAVINIYTIYSFALTDPTLQSIANSKTAAEAEIAEVKKQLDSIANVGKVQKFLLQYGAFMAAVTQAQNSDDVAKAIEAAALPSGSSRIKRETPFNVSLNAYTGLFIGNESIQGISNKNTINSYGVTAPVGVAISLGQKKFFNPFGGIGHSSYTLFLSVIDLGAVAAYRFKDDTTSQVPTIKLKNIFSPGAFLSIGVPKTPLSINLGAQVGPNLRQIDGTGTGQPSQDAENRTYWRYSVALVVDIPVLNFYTKPHKANP